MTPDPTAPVVRCWRCQRHCPPGDWHAPNDSLPECLDEVFCLERATRQERARNAVRQP